MANNLAKDDAEAVRRQAHVRTRITMLGVGIAVVACIASASVCMNEASAYEREATQIAKQIEKAEARVHEAKSTDVVDVDAIQAAYDDMNRIGSAVCAYQDTGEGRDGLLDSFDDGSYGYLTGWGPITFGDLNWTFAPSQTVDNDGMYPASWVGTTDEGVIWAYATARYSAKDNKFYDLKRTLTVEGGRHIPATNLPEEYENA